MLFQFEKKELFDSLLTFYKKDTTVIIVFSLTYNMCFGLAL